MRRYGGSRSQARTAAMMLLIPPPQATRQLLLLMVNGNTVGSHTAPAAARTLTWSINASQATWTD